MSWAYTGGCKYHPTNAIVVREEVTGIEKHSCTLCGYAFWEEKATDRKMVLSEVVERFPEHWEPDTLAWARECEQENTGWYNPYQ